MLVAIIRGCAAFATSKVPLIVALGLCSLPAGNILLLLILLLLLLLFYYFFFFCKWTVF